MSRRRLRKIFGILGCLFRAGAGRRETGLAGITGIGRTENGGNAHEGLAEGAGFEPAIRVTVCTLSKRVP